MAAIFEEFANGDDFNASDFNTFSMRQALIACDNQTDRDSIATPQEGIHVWRKDTDAIEIYDGAAWLAFDTKWQSFTPTWKQGTTNWSSLGSGATNVGKYKRHGKAIEMYANLILGSGASIGGAGLLGVVCPITGMVTESLDGTAFLQDTSAPASRNYHLRSTSTDIILPVTETDAAAQSTVPWTWAVGDILRVKAHYEIT